MKTKLLFFASLLAILVAAAPAAAQTETPIVAVVVAPGDTWTALAWAYQSSPAALQALNGVVNPALQPPIGGTVLVPAAPGTPRPGRLLRPNFAGLWSTAAAYGADLSLLAAQTGQDNPFAPLFYRPVVIPGGSTPPRDLPAGVDRLYLSAAPAQPGQALAFNLGASGPLSATVTLAGYPFVTQVTAGGLIGVNSTGAFYPPGALQLTINQPGRPIWSQPWLFVEGSWLYQEITLTGDAATITSEEIAAERERLFALWSNVTPLQWTGAFRLPVDSFLEISSPYGVRRSYNGGPYRSYHEGVDFSAYGGTPVLAPAAGTVVLAEFLRVRGGSVIIDHGLGVFSGFYHQSQILVTPGQVVAPGDQLGAVGTTGLSTGNHLHWDLLVDGIWVDALAWREQNIACALLPDGACPAQP